MKLGLRGQCETGLEDIQVIHTNEEDHQFENY